ncbi:MAG TPA: AraC family transcriptional regulator, partial [Microvirga sp.]|nr:AraC family transcriptional regulator [Microvirga sp.]
MLDEDGAMQDYSSAALVALIRRALDQQGLGVPEIGERGSLPLPKRTPHARLSEKRRLLDAVLATHGPEPLLLVGQSIRGAPFDPVAHMLLRAPTGADLIARWMRLERYQHSHHRIIVEQASERCLDLRHVGRGDAVPAAAESLLVAGVLTGLLCAQGCEDVSLHLASDGGHLALVVQHGRFMGLPQGWEQEDTDRWRLVWSADPPLRAPAVESGEELGLIERSRLGPTARRVLARVAADPPHRFTLAGLATELRCSPRTLQRRLGEDGLSLTEAVALARLREAARLLAGSDLPLTQVGFVAGYSDAAHFARAFKAATAMRPSEYRAARVQVAL